VLFVSEGELTLKQLAETLRAPEFARSAAFRRGVWFFPGTT